MKFFLLNRRVFSKNPIVNLLIIISGIIVTVASLVLGFFAFLIIGSIVLVIIFLIGIRMWWLNNKIYKNMSSRYKERAYENKKNEEYIEGVYQVIDDDDESK